MSTSPIKVALLKVNDLTPQALADLNTLLKMQRGHATNVDVLMVVETLRNGSTKVVVAWHNDRRIIGLGVLALVNALSHKHATIHNLVVADGFPIETTAQSILELLMTDLYIVAYVEAGAWLQNASIIAVLKAMRFEEKNRPRLRYRFPAVAGETMDMTPPPTPAAATA